MWQVFGNYAPMRLLGARFANLQVAFDSFAKAEKFRTRGNTGKSGRKQRWAAALTEVEQRFLSPL